jgi:predicted chitinase
MITRILQKIKSWFVKPKPKMPEPRPEIKEEPVVAQKPFIPRSISAIIAQIELEFGDLSAKQEQGIAAILSECFKQELINSKCAYLLATAWHETNKTMEPVREAYWLSENWRKNNLRYYPYYGRGFVQLTWKPNYDAYGIADDPDKALELEFAAHVLVHGSINGVFTGRKLEHYFSLTTKDDPINARRIINGTDKAHLIAGYHYKFLNAIKAAT